MSNNRIQSSAPRKRRSRSRPLPKWLKEQQDLDDMARRRCLLVLAVLSGEKPVTEAITEAGISRPLYYQLEEKALKAMLRALMPGTEAEPSNGADGLTRRVTELEARLQRAEIEKRRAERLLFLARKVLPKGRMTTGPGRPRKPTASSSTSTGRRRSTRLKPLPTEASEVTNQLVASTLKRDGGDES